MQYVRTYLISVVLKKIMSSVSVCLYIHICMYLCTYVCLHVCTGVIMYVCMYEPKMDRFLEYTVQYVRTTVVMFQTTYHFLRQFLLKLELVMTRYRYQ